MKLIRLETSKRSRFPSRSVHVISRLATVTAVLALLAGCSVDNSSVSSPRDSPTESPSNEGSELSSECRLDVAAEIDATISAQLAAFSQKDFPAAFALASAGFQQNTDVETFRQVIELSYPEVADSVKHRIDECRQLSPSTAFALVAVKGQTGNTVKLGYRLVLESGNWRIDGASTVASGVDQEA